MSNLPSEVCRLCLAESNLVWVFDNRFAKTDHMKDVIFVTTGVEIHMKDVISQKICIKCAYDAIKMFRFREKALKNDKHLKEECRKLLKDQKIKIPHTDVTIKTEKTDPTKDEDKRQTYKVHPSLYALSKKYPKTQFPSICVKSHVAPIVSMEMDAVENYFRARNLKMEDHVRLALRQDPKNQEEHRVPPINIVKDRSTGYSIRISIDDDDDDQQINHKEYNKSMRKRRRRLSDDDLPDVGESKPTVFPCPNCSDVLDNAEDLETHKTCHLRCHFCRTDFPTVTDREDHEETACYHKKALEILPDVEVSRIDDDPTLRKSYPQAFVELAPAGNSAPMEIIEILSDDEDDNRSSATVLKPDVKISDSDLLDKVKKQSSDIMLIKEFLLRYKIGPRASDKELQTELPHNKSIKVDEKALTVELSGLKHLVSFYKIPVYVTKFGPLKAQYNYEPVKVEPKKLFYWNDLKPIDIESKGSRVIKSSAAAAAADSRTVDSDVNSDRVQNAKLKHQTDNCETGTKSTTKIKASSCNKPEKRGKKRSSTEINSDTSKKKPPVESTSSEAIPSKKAPECDGNISSKETNASKLLKSLCEKPSLMLESNHNSSKMSDINFNNLLKSSAPANLGFSFNNGTTTITPLNRIDTLSTETSTLLQGHSDVSIPRTSPNNPATVTPVVISNIILPGTSTVSITSVQPIPNIDNNDRRRLPAQVNSNVPRNSPLRTFCGNQTRMYSFCNKDNISMQNQLHSNVLPRMSSNNHHPNPPHSGSETSPNDQPLSSRHQPSTTNAFSRTSSDYQPSLPSHLIRSSSSVLHSNVPNQTPTTNVFSRTSPDYQPQLLSNILLRISPNSQPLVPSQLHSNTLPRTSPIGQSAVPSQLHSNTLPRSSPNNQPHVPSELNSNSLPRTSPIGQSAVPSQFHSNTLPRTSPIGQPLVPSQLHSNTLPRTSPNNQPHVPSELNSNSLPRTSPISQSAVPSHLHSNTLPRSFLNNQPLVPSELNSNTLPRTSPYSVPPVPSQLHSNRPSMTFRVPGTSSSVPSDALNGFVSNNSIINYSMSYSAGTSVTMRDSHCFNTLAVSGRSQYYNNQQEMMQQVYKTWHPPAQDYGTYRLNQQVPVDNNGRSRAAPTVRPQKDTGQNVARLAPPSYDEASFNIRQGVNSIRVRNLCELR